MCSRLCSLSVRRSLHYVRVKNLTARIMKLVNPFEYSEIFWRGGILEISDVLAQTVCQSAFYDVNFTKESTP